MAFYKQMIWMLVVTQLVVVDSSFGKDKNKSESPLESLKMVEGDETGNEVKALKAELLVSSSEQKAIEQVKKLIRRHKGSPIEPELYFRLAELHMRRAKTDRFFEINRQSETIVNLVPRIVEKASSKKTAEEAVATYDYIQKNFPHFHQMDLVIFNNAFARQGLGQDKKAEQLYWQLIKDYKKSPLVPDSHLAVGEINFDRGNFKYALEHFDAIKNYSDSKVYPYGLYKAAWAHYNMRDAEAGLKKLEEVVTYGKYVADNHIESRLDLRKEALFDMTLFFEDVYPAKDAFTFFRKQAGELDVAPTILKLAKLYDRHSRYREMQVVMDDFIRYLPKSSLIPSIRNELAWNYENMKMRDQAIAELNKLSTVCQPSSEWMKTQGDQASQSKAYAECSAMFNESSLKFAGKWLKIWKKNPAFGEFADSAEKAFALYLSRNPSGKDAGEARFAYAELLFQRQKFRQASTEYALVSKAGATSSVAISHDASYAALLSLEKAVGEKWNDADEKSFHELATSYTKNHPKGKYRLDIEFKLALIAYEKERYAEAAPLFLRLGQDYPRTEKGQKSQDLYLDILNIKKDYKGLTQYAQELLKTESSDSRRQKLSKIYEESYFLQIQKMEDEKKFAEAIQSYKAFIKANPNSALVEKALWNSMQLQFKTMDYWGGAQAAVEYYDRYPQSKEGTNALLKAAQTYESTAQLEEAAQVLMKLTKADPKNENKWLVLAADFYLLSGRFAHAKKAYLELAKLPDEKIRAHTLEKMALIEKTYGTADGHKNVLKEISRSGVEPQASYARIQLLEQLYSSGQASEAFSEAKKIVGSSAPTFALAKARFIQARILEDEFISQSLKSKVDRIGLVLAIKTEKLDKVQKAYQSAIRYGDAKVSVDSLQRLSNCYSHYVKALKEMSVPAGLSAAEATEFKAELERLAVPLEEKGVETLAQAVTTAKKFKLYDGTVAKMQKELNRANLKKVDEYEIQVGTPAAVVPYSTGMGT